MRDDLTPEEMRSLKLWVAWTLASLAMLLLVGMATAGVIPK